MTEMDAMTKTSGVTLLLGLICLAGCQELKKQRTVSLSYENPLWPDLVHCLPFLER